MSIEKSQVVIYLLLLGATFLIILVFIISFLWLFKKRQLQNQIERQNHQKELFQTQIEIQEQTFKNISQEIHDNIGQVLSLAKLNLHTMKLGDKEKLSDTRNLVSKALNDLRDLSRSMHGDRITEIGLHESIKQELKILENTGVFKTAIHITGTVFQLDQQKQMVIFRIVQECLSNALKYSNAKTITVALDYSPQLFALTVKDDGQGFSFDSLNLNEKGIGLKNIKNRATLLGGSSHIDSRIGNGTSITVYLPQLIN